MPPPDFNSGLGDPAGGGSGDRPPRDDGRPARDEKEIKRAMEAYRFDSSALERAAAAAKELEKSSKPK